MRSLEVREMPDTEDKSQIIDFRQAREKKLDEKRRKAERIFFKDLLGIYSVADDKNFHAVEFLEISEKGCSFRVPYDPDSPWPQDANNIPLRLYFSQETYLPIQVSVKNSTSQIEEGVRYVRYGCEVHTENSNYETYRQFVRFLKMYSENAHKDNGRVSMFYL
jgi:hypothetical protein